MREDLDVFDFHLSKEDLRRIAAMDLHRSEIIDFKSPVTERLLRKFPVPEE